MSAAGSNVAFKIETADTDMVTFNSLYKVAIALSNNTVADPLQGTV